jgi:hypothetical protein
VADTGFEDTEINGLLPGAEFPTLRLYLGGKMLGVPGFGFTDFDEAAAALRAMGQRVFNPAERDRGVGLDTTSMSGTLAELEHVGFSRREALTADMEWIGKNSEGMVVLPTWPHSPGTLAEMQFHYGLYLPVWRLEDFLKFGPDIFWQLTEVDALRWRRRS